MSNLCIYETPECTRAIYKENSKVSFWRLFPGVMLGHNDIKTKERHFIVYSRYYIEGLNCCELLAFLLAEDRQCYVAVAQSVCQFLQGQVFDLAQSCICPRIRPV